MTDDYYSDTAAELESLRLRLADYENAITWDTTCLNCSRLLDASIADHERAEKAEAEVERLRTKLHAANNQLALAGLQLEECAIVIEDLEAKVASS